jgi:hypothetical protein
LIIIFLVNENNILLNEQVDKLFSLGTSEALRIPLEEQLLTEEKLRKFVEQQLEERDKKNHVLREAIERRKGGWKPS